MCGKSTHIVSHGIISKEMLQKERSIINLTEIHATLGTTHRIKHNRHKTKQY